MATIAENLLYECIRELSYVHSVENCTSELCKSPVGAELIERGMRALGVHELAEETLDAQKLAEWNRAARPGGIRRVEPLLAGHVGSQHAQAQL